MYLVQRRDSPVCGDLVNWDELGRRPWLKQGRSSLRLQDEACRRQPSKNVEEVSNMKELCLIGTLDTVSAETRDG